MNRYNQPLAFLSKLAIICNVCFVLSMMVMYLPGFKYPVIFMNFVAAIGLEMAPFVSLLFGVVFLIYKINKWVIVLPRWQTILNILMICIQLIFIIF